MQDDLLGPPYDRVIRYGASDALDDPLSRLERRMAAGKVRLPFAPGRGYLDALLRHLGVPVSSQCLVFSKTSLQKDRIGPRTPRAIYFTDRVFVAWAPNAAEIEVVSVDPVRGPVFTTIQQDPGRTPRPVRRADCFRCHLGPKTQRVPGLLLRSVRTSGDGTALSDLLEFVNGHGAPLSARWGGWYVTGTSANDRHRGNVAAPGADDAGAFDGTGVTDLRGRVDLSRYLSAHSDIVALLVLEHTVGMLNRLVRAGYESRVALDARARGEESAAGVEERIGRVVSEVLEYLLMGGEAALRGEVRGSGPYASQFVRGGVRDAKGRSLRDLDLRRRLFRHPCSYLIHSPIVDALPEAFLTRLWRRLDAVLTGRERGGECAALSARDREAVREILRATKPSYAAWVRGHAAR